MSDTAALQCPRSITDEDRARAQIYQLLAVLLSSPPSDELLKGLASLQGDDTPLGSAYKNLAALAQRTTAVDAEQEFNNLFIGVGRGELLPYASYYLTGFLNEKPLADLRTDLMTRGVKVSDGVKEPEFLKQVETFQKWLEARPDVTRTLSVVDILKATHRSLNGGDQAFYKLPENREMIGQELFLYTMSLPQGMDINDRITLKNDAIRVTVLWTISDSKRWMEETAFVANHAKESGLDITITGKGNIYQSMNPYVVESFVRSISIALVLISILLITVFGSVKMGMIALLPNCIPLLLGGAAFWFLGKSIDVGSVLVMSVCLGIAVDDTIHLLSNYNRLIKDGLSPQKATAEVLAHTSPALIFTTIILVLGFGTLAFATFVPNIYFGIMTAIILTLALFTDLTFLLAVLTKEEEPQNA